MQDGVLKYYTKKETQKMQIIERNGKWTIRYINNGKYVRITTDYLTSNVSKRDIKRLAQSIVQSDMEKRKKEQDNPYLHDSLESLSNLFLKQRSLGVKSGTQYSDQKKFKVLFEFFDKSKRAVDEIKPQKVIQYKLWLTNNRTAKTINGHMTLLRQFIKFLTLSKVLDYVDGENMIQLLSSVKDNCDLKPSKEKRFWTPEDYDKFISTFTKEDEFGWKVFFEVEYWCGLRIGEVQGLQFKDFDFDNKTLTLSRMVDEFGEVKPYLKTKSSMATIYVRQEVIEDIKKYKEMVYGTNDDFMFFPDRVRQRNAINERRNKHCKLANLPPINSHGLRHSMASRLVNSGANILFVQKQMRHSSSTTTLDVYSHSFPELERGVIDKV